MRQEFYGIYGRLYSLYSTGRESLLTSRLPIRSWRKRTALIAEAIRVAEERLSMGERVRPDARLFLLVNLDQMVVLPVGLAGVEELTRHRYHGLLRTIVDDVMLLLSTAARDASNETVSAHHLITALATRWKDLKLAKHEIWG